jgi:putative redox protein
MSTTKVATITMTGGYRFEATAGSGRTIVMDDGPEPEGPTPAELIGIALGGCTAMDVIAILRKQRQVVTGYEIRVTGRQRDRVPHAFVRFDVVHVLDGEDLDLAAVRRAIDLSSRKYCSVGSTLASGSAELHHAYLVRSPDGTEQSAEVLVTGPYTRPEELAAAQELAASP